VVSAPIVGTTSIKNLEDIIGICLVVVYECVQLIDIFFAAGANVVLTPEEIKYLEEPYKAQPIIGHA
jgi:hypothetical protein